MIGAAKMAFKGPSGPVVPTGKLFMWGSNSNYQLVDGTTAAKSSPIQVGAAADWSVVTMAQDAQSVLAIRGGKLFAWGAGGNGILGLGDTNSRSSPVQVGAATDWVNVWASGGSAYGVRRGAAVPIGDPVAGYLYAWGANPNGELGDGTITNRSSPVPIGADDGWTYIGAGGYLSLGFALGIRSGKLYGWGLSSNGANGSASTYSSPVQVGADTNWQFTSAGLGWSHSIRTGLLFAMGRAFNGELGLGAPGGPFSSPVPVGGIGNWGIAVSGGNTVMGLRSGSLYAWGYNAEGLGNGTTNCNSPIAIGAETDWETIAAGGQTDSAACMMGIRGGKLFMWGRGTSGQLGNGTAANAASPIQVGAATDWLWEAPRIGCVVNGFGIRP